MRGVLFIFPEKRKMFQKLQRIFRPENRRKLEEPQYYAPEWSGKDVPEDISSLFSAAAKYMTMAKPYLDPDLDLNSFARALHTNRLYVSRAISACAGMNFRRFVNCYRIKYAVDMMDRDRRLKIEEVSRLCGFNSQPSFNYAFKTCMGMTPSEYLRKLNRRKPHPQVPSNSEGQGL